MTVAATQRWTAGRPCPICGGHERDPRGQSRRCIGFLSADGRFARCSREEYAGGLAADASGAFVHLLDGACRCGTQQHGAGGASRTVSAAGSGDKPRIVATYDYRDEEGALLYQVVRLDP